MHFRSFEWKFLFLHVVKNTIQNLTRSRKLESSSGTFQHFFQIWIRCELFVSFFIFNSRKVNLWIKNLQSRNFIWFFLPPTIVRTCMFGPIFSIPILWTIFRDKGILKQTLHNASTFETKVFHRIWFSNFCFNRKSYCESLFVQRAKFSLNFSTHIRFSVNLFTTFHVLRQRFLRPVSFWSFLEYLQENIINYFNPEKQQKL